MSNARQRAAIFPNHQQHNNNNNDNHLQHLLLLPVQGFHWHCNARLTQRQLWTEILDHRQVLLHQPAPWRHTQVFQVSLWWFHNCGWYDTTQRQLVSILPALTTSRRFPVDCCCELMESLYWWQVLQISVDCFIECLTVCAFHPLRFVTLIAQSFESTSTAGEHCQVDQTTVRPVSANNVDDDNNNNDVQSASQVAQNVSEQDLLSSPSHQSVMKPKASTPINGHTNTVSTHIPQRDGQVVVNDAEVIIIGT